MRITEIFYSLQGEGLSAGEPTVFVRLTGCPLRCGYCDTSYAFQGGEWMTLQQILDQVAEYHCPQVCVTGGEPLAQPDTPTLLSLLCDADYRVSLETSGALDVGSVDSRVVKVMDLKTPSSGEQERNRLDNLRHLVAGDQIKFVIGNRSDYEWSREMLCQHHLEQRAKVLFSPVAQQLDPTLLANWILEDSLPVRLQLQLHKLLWGEERGH